MATTLDNLRNTLGEYFPALLRRVEEGSDVYQALAAGHDALETGSLSWARLNQIMHMCSQAGMSEGFYEYYFLKIPQEHPYPVEQVFGLESFEPPEGATEIKSLKHLYWGVRRFIYDAMLYWGNFRQAYRDLRQFQYQDIEEFFAAKRVNEARMIRRGAITEPVKIRRDHRYLISEMACKTYEAKRSLEEVDHVKLALNAFSQLQETGKPITSSSLREKTLQLAKDVGQGDLFDLLYEDTEAQIRTKDEVLSIYSGQWEAFQKARKQALDNTRIYLSICSDLDAYVATSMRSREDFRDMAATCEEIFSDERLKKYKIRYFDPTLSAAEHHEDKGIIECLMVKTAKVVLYFAQYKESLGKVSEYAMGLSLGKPVIILCPSDLRGKEIYEFYQEKHPLTRLVEFKSGIVNGAMITHDVRLVPLLLDRIFSNKMEYDLQRKNDTDAYYLLKERLTQSTVRIVTDNQLLTETFWNNFHGVF